MDSIDAGIFSEVLSVLIVDGDKAAGSETRATLLLEGIGSDASESGSEAMDMIRLHHARRQDYDLILVDISLPEGSGLSMIQGMRGLMEDSSTVIIVTSGSSLGNVAQAKEAGADAFLKKPFSAEDVLRAYSEVKGTRGDDSAKSLKTLDGRRVLVAEDMTVNAEIMKQLLSMNFIEVDHAKNGEEALEMFEKSPKNYYDAILMDVRMPIMDGLAATSAIRGLGRSDAKTVPIIAFTTNKHDEDVQRSLSAGMNAHLEKPVEPDQIYRTLAELIEKRRE